MTVRRTRFVSTGSSLPRQCLSNDELSRMVETSDDWIVQRTGIRQRHLAGDGETTGTLAVNASQVALERAGVSAADVDLIIVATTTPDHTFPATATRVQADLGMTRGVAFDLQAVCSGFVFALATADNFIRLGQADRALVIGSETFTRLLDWTDRTTCVLFGDGAGAVLLEGIDGSGTVADQGVLSTHIYSDGRQYEKLMVDGGPSSTRTVGHVRMDGKEVFKHAVSNMAYALEEALNSTGFKVADLDWVIPHQANRRILDATAKRVALDPEKIIISVDRHANTSAASVPLALDKAVCDGRIKPGQLLLLEAMGGGFTWGSALVRW